MAGGTPSYSAPEVSAAIELAVEEAERLHGTLEKIPFLVTDNGSCFLARHFQKAIKDRFRHVRTRYRTPQQWLDTFRTYYGPVHKTFGALDPGKQEALAADLIGLAQRFNSATDGTLAAPSEYLEVVIRTR